MATVSPGLRSASRNYGRLRKAVSHESTLPVVFKDSVRMYDHLKAPTYHAANSKLSIIDIEHMLRERVEKKQEELFNSFKSYDVAKNLSVTRGEFRRVLEAYCLPLTTEQFDTLMNKVPVNPNSTVRYVDFMERFGVNTSNLMVANSEGKWTSASQRYGSARVQLSKEKNIDRIEQMLKDKIKEGSSTVLKGLRFYDYNRDDNIKKDDLRKVFDANCFKMSDYQFDKLYQRYDFNNRGAINYKDFLRRLGINVELIRKPSPVPPRSANTMHAVGFSRQGNADKVLFSNTPQLRVTSLSASEDKNKVFNWQDFPEQRWRAKAAETKLLVGSRHHLEDEIKGGKLLDVSLHIVELQFRNLIRENYANLKRMFMVFDTYNDGFIKLEDLKSVLCQFTIPMSDQLFSQLMDKCGVKATGKIPWEYFLERFQDPQSHGNGQTIPIKPAHRYNPIRGGDVSLGTQEVVKLLTDQVSNGYSSLKKAFLEIDRNRDGKITRKELRRILHSFNVHISEDQSKSLFAILDPSHSNFISYHRFLDLFEERETVEGHKWLKSCHRFNDQPKPLIMAWETKGTSTPVWRAQPCTVLSHVMRLKLKALSMAVEDILRNKIEDNWEELSTHLINYDPKISRRILPKQLRRTLEHIAVPISDEHFDSLLSKVPRGEDNKLDYVDFLNMLKVTVKPGDLHGVSTMVHDSSNEAEQKRGEEQLSRLVRGEQRLTDRTNGMNISEIISSLKDHISQASPSIRKIFLKYDVKNNGKVTKNDFRKILETRGFNMSDSTFAELCAKLSFRNNVMTYNDFVANFENPGIGGPPTRLVRESNFRVNAIRGEEQGLTASEVEARLRTKLRDNFEDLRAAFYKFDDDHNGLVTKANLRRMLNSFMCPLSDGEFKKLCERLNINRSINYQEFLERFQTRDTEEGHKWLVSNHRYNEVQPTKPLTAEMAYVALTEKAHELYVDLSKTFLKIDTKKDGIIKKRELRGILKTFGLVVEDAEFQKLWAMYDTDKKGYLTYQEYLKHLNGEKFAPSDLNGVSFNIIKDSYQKLDDHHKKQQMRQDAITKRQVNYVEDMPVHKIIRELRDQLREKYFDLYMAFKKFDTRRRGYLTAKEMHNILTDLNYFLDDDQFYDLLDILKLHENGRMTYADFLVAFEEGRKDCYAPQQQDISSPIAMDARVLGEKADSKLRGNIASQLDVLEKAFRSFDQRLTGQISLTDFRRVIDYFCYKLTNKQFSHVVSKLPSSRSGFIDYAIYIQSFKRTDKDADKWIRNVQLQTRMETPAVTTEEEVNALLKEQVTAKSQELAKAFKDTDFALIGVVTRVNFRDVLNDFIVKLTDEQFDRLWESMPVNEFGNIDYNAFLQRYTTDSGSLSRPKSSTPSPTKSRSNTMVSDRRSSSRSSLMSSSSMLPKRAFTPMVNAENVERRLKDAVYRNWKDIRRECRAADTDNSGQVSYDLFKKIIHNLDSSLVDDDMNTLFLKYDLKNNNHFCYNDFLRHFVLNRQSLGESLLNRKKLQPTKVSNTAHGDATDDVSTRVKACVMDNWKELRRELAKLDMSNTGLVSLDEIRQVLRNYQLNLEEYEFHSLMSLFEKDFSGKINYRNFIKAFLHGS